MPKRLRDDRPLIATSVRPKLDLLQRLVRGIIVTNDDTKFRVVKPEETLQAFKGIPQSFQLTRTMPQRFIGICTR